MSFNDNDSRCMVCGGHWQQCNCCETCMVHDTEPDGCECGTLVAGSVPSFIVWVNPDGPSTIEHGREISHVA